jgi:hypothetical protein
MLLSPRFFAPHAHYVKQLNFLCVLVHAQLCSDKLDLCPLCRERITSKLHIFD